MQCKTIEKSAFTVAGLAVKTNLEKQKEDAYALFGRMFQPGIIERIPAKKNPDALISLYKDFDEAEGTYVLMLGYEVTDTQNIPADMTIVSVPAAQYTVFTATGEIPEASVRAWETINSWRKNPHLRRTGTVSFEILDSRSRQGPDSQVDIYLPMLG